MPLNIMGTAQGAHRLSFLQQAQGSPYFVSVFASRYVTSGYGPWFDPDPDARSRQLIPALAGTGSGDFIIVIVAGDGIGSIGCLPCTNVPPDELRSRFRAQLAAVQALRRPTHILFAAGGTHHPARLPLLDDARHADSGAMAEWLDPADGAPMYTYAVYFPCDERVLLFTRAEQIQLPWDDSHLLRPWVSGMTMQSYPDLGTVRPAAAAP